MVSEGTNTAAMIPPEVLDKMPPAQRAKIEERMKMSMGPRTTVSKRCLTSEELSKPFQPTQPREGCTYTTVSSTRSKQEFKMECTNGGGKQSGTFVVEPVDSTSLKGSMKMVMSMGGKESNINWTFTSKLISPVCTEDKK